MTEKTDGKNICQKRVVSCGVIFDLQDEVVAVDISQVREVLEPPPSQQTLSGAES